MSSSLRKFWKFIKRNETARGLLLVGIVILGALAVWGGIRLALNTEYPILVVSSGSMCPANYCTLAVGALILIRGEDPGSIQAGPDCGTPAVGPSATTGPLGSIIVFRPNVNNPDYLVVHRVRQIVTLPGNQLAFRTEGDNFYTNGGGCDPWPYANGAVPSNQVVGVYQATIPIPYLGSTILGIRGFMYDDQTGQPRPEGILVIVLLIIALFAFEVIEPSKKSKKPEATSAEPSPEPTPTPAVPEAPKMSEPDRA